MSYDGLLVRAQISEIKKIILNERISKITQKNNKNISLLFRKNNNDIIFSININPNFPHIILENEKPKTYQNPYAFTMLLRKYLEGGMIIGINQIDGISDYNSLERIVEITVKNTIETGDIKEYKLIIELLGRYSNALIVDENNTIIDVLLKIKDTDNQLRILKAKEKYSTDKLYKKQTLINISFDDFILSLKNAYTMKSINKEPINIYNIFLQAFYGLSKSYIINLIYKLKIDENELFNCLLRNENYECFIPIYEQIIKDINNILNNNYMPRIYYEGKNIKDFHILSFDIYDKSESFDNINDMLSKYISLKYGNNSNNENLNNLKTKINKLIEKTLKKIEINELDIEKSKDYENDKLYADMIKTYGYNKENIKDDILYCKNYYDNNKNLEIKLDSKLSIQKNAEMYYNNYNKKKRTIDKSNEQIKRYNNQLEHLNDLLENLKYINETNDLLQIETELENSFKTKNTGIVKKKQNNKTMNIKHYKAYDGTDIYIGKNNIQNDYLTFNIADANDTWLHVKNATGSHVIIKKNYEDLDIKILEQAASLASFYSSLRNENKVTVDYTLRKELKKVKGKPLGFVIYHKNKSINVEPKIELKEIK